jgi:hypothetical protein
MYYKGLGIGGLGLGIGLVTRGLRLSITANRSYGVL